MNQLCQMFELSDPDSGIYHVTRVYILPSPWHQQMPFLRRPFLLTIIPSSLLYRSCPNLLKVAHGKTAEENDNEVKTESEDSAEQNDKKGENQEEEEAGGTEEMRAAERKKQLGKFPYFRIEMSILNGRELIAMDRGGTSDPYVKVVQVKIMETQTVCFKVSKESQKGEEELHRTPEKKKTVNPVWNDQFNLYIESPFTPLTFQVDKIQSTYLALLMCTWLFPQVTCFREKQMVNLLGSR